MAISTDASKGSADDTMRRGFGRARRRNATSGWVRTSDTLTGSGELAAQSAAREFLSHQHHEDISPVERRPDDPEVFMRDDLFAHAEELERAGHFVEAVVKWRAAAAADRQPETLARLGRLCLREGLVEEGERVLREAISSCPDHPDAYFYLAVHLKNRGDLDEARELLETCVRLGEWAPALVVLGEVYRRLKVTDAARQCFERATLLDPTDSEAWYGLGLMHEFVDDERALNFFRKALETDRNNNAAHRELGHMLWRRGDSVSAEEHIRAALRLDGRDAWAHDYLGVVFRWTNRNEEAEREFRAAVELWSLPLFHCHLGDALIRLGRISEGKQSYTTALSLDVGYYLANLRMGQLLRDQGKLAQARTYIERALQADPSNREAREALSTLPLR